MKEEVWTADFETTSQENLIRDGRVRVWLWSFVRISDGLALWGKTLDDFMEYISSADKIYFHNLKFDGKFIVYWLSEHGYLYGNDYTVVIDNMNNWYEIKLMWKGKVIRIWDSLKKFPGTSVNGVAKMFGIEGKKEKPYFDLYRPEGYEPTKAEIDYCIQDSRIIAYAMKKELEKGHKGITLSYDAFANVKEFIGGYQGWRKNFPILEDFYETFVRRSYKGGFVYVNPKFKNKTLNHVTVYDVNSLYPHVMRNCELPFGKPTYRKPFGSEFYVCHFKAEFELIEGMLPTIQIKNNPRWKETEYLTSSEGEMVDLYMTSIDYKLFDEHYDIIDMTEPEYVCFKTKTGLLKDYIDYWTDVKIQAKANNQDDIYWNAKRWLNSPYGKTGMNPNRLSKVPVMGDDGLIRFELIDTTCDPIYVPYASFVCAQARNITIRSAQAEYENFVYADTDSIHLLGDQHGELDVDQYRLGAWKNEGTFELAKYLRPKTYIHAHWNNEAPDRRSIEVDEIKCAGMTDNIKADCTWEQFYPGSNFGEKKLLQYNCKGGCLLCPTTYRIKT